MTEIFAFELDNTMLTWSDARAAFRRWWVDRHTPKIDNILTVVAVKFDIDRQDLIRDSHDQKVVIARLVAMYLCRKLTSASLEVIASRFGHRTRATVVNASWRVPRLCSENADLALKVAETQASIEKPAN